jgi:hypothetical protein
MRKAIQNEELPQFNAVEVKEYLQDKYLRVDFLNINDDGEIVEEEKGFIINLENKYFTLADEELESLKPINNESDILAE